VNTDASAEARKALFANGLIEEVADAPPLAPDDAATDDTPPAEMDAPQASPKAPVLSVAEISDGTLAEFKRWCQENAPKLVKSDLSTPANGSHATNGCRRPSAAKWTGAEVVANDGQPKAADATTGAEAQQAIA